MEKMMDLDELAEITGLTKRAIYNMRHRGDGPPAYRVGSRLRFRCAEVEAWIDSLAESDHRRAA